MPQQRKCSLEAASDAEDNGNWFLDTLLDLVDQGKAIIAQHLARLVKP